MRVDEDNLPVAPKPQFAYAMGRWVLPSITIISDEPVGVSDVGQTIDGEPWQIQSPIIILQSNRLSQNLVPPDYRGVMDRVVPRIYEIPTDGFGVIEVDTGRIGWIPHEIVQSDRIELVEKESTLLHYVDAMLERRGWFPIQVDLEELFEIRIEPPSPEEFDDSMSDWI